MARTKVNPSFPCKGLTAFDNIVALYGEQADFMNESPDNFTPHADVRADLNTQIEAELDTIRQLCLDPVRGKPVT